MILPSANSLASSGLLGVAIQHFCAGWQTWNIPPVAQSTQTAPRRKLRGHSGPSQMRVAWTLIRSHVTLFKKISWSASTKLNARLSRIVNSSKTKADLNSTRLPKIYDSEKDSCTRTEPTSFPTSCEERSYRYDRHQSPCHRSNYV